MTTFIFTVLAINVIGVSLWIVLRCADARMRRIEESVDRHPARLPILDKPTCPHCRWVIVGPPDEHLCDWK